MIIENIKLIVIITMKDTYKSRDTFMEAGPGVKYL